LLCKDDVQTQEQLRQFCKNDTGYTDLKHLRGSPEYLKAVKRDLFATIRQLPPGCLFVTLSAADTKWPELLEAMYQLNAPNGTMMTAPLQLSQDEVEQLLVREGVTATLYSAHRLRATIQLIMHDTTLLGPAAANG
jgi:hypothetical protein